MEKSGRNSLIELLRFVFAFFIICYHNLFVVEIPLFSDANFVVDFFFIITGMYMTRILSKYDDLPAVKGGYKLLVDRFIKLGIPLLICYVASIACNAIAKDNNMQIHYLWFIHIMFISYLLFFILWRVFNKNKSYFYFSAYIVAFFAVILRFGALIKFNVPFFDNFFKDSYYFDEVRGLLCIPLGMFLALSPDIKFKNDKKKKIISWIVIGVSIVLIFVGLIFTRRSLNEKMIVEIVCDFVLFPAILYFAKYVSFSNKVINVLGASSFYLYIYQSLGALQRTFGIKSGVVFFSTIIIATVITMIWKFERARRKAAKEVVVND